MKKITPLLLACAIFLIAANPPPVSVFGPCQRRCVKQFGEIQKRHTNIDTQFLYTNVSNRTEFSLCKLGCSSPEYTELHLPAFRFGQIAYEEILNSISPTALIHLPNPVKDVQILCLDKSPANPNSSKNSTQQKLTGNILLKFDDELEALENVYFIEVVASDEEQTILFQDWCYSSLCNISFLAPENAQIRARLSSFDENGAIGGIVHSSWYPISEEPNLDMKVVSLDWLDDKAAAKIQLIPKKSNLKMFATNRIQK
ncbi:unnamed protein product [Caenorhabditis angaria]|uniref:Uncharacterized protein n=1 Tax=Caenorhabditis angaria TaxID=860376 RepID=A0A9P1J4N7_9PELO|nr:unnamed protein product [Caenorhabditis angaria]